MQSLLEKNLISTKIASNLSGYNSDYLGRLCRGNKIRGTRVGRTWFIERDSLLTFVEEQKKRKEKLANDLSESREQEYQLAQKTLQTVTQVGTIPETNSGRTFQTLHVTASSTHAFSNPFLALALSLAVVSASTFVASAELLPKLAQIGGEKVASIKSAFPENIEVAPRFRPTDITATAQESDVEIVVDEALAMVTQIVNTEDITLSNSNRAEETAIVIAENVVVRGNERSEFLGTIFRSPNVLVRASNQASTKIYFATPTLAKSVVDSVLLAHKNFINESADGVLTVGTLVRDVGARMPKYSRQILDTYAVGITVWSEGSPILAREITAQTLSLGLNLGSIALLLPSHMESTYDASVLAYVERSHATVSTITEKEIELGTRVIATTEEYQNNHLATINWLGERSFSSYESARGTVAKTREIPGMLTDMALGVAGKTALALQSPKPAENSTREENTASVLFSFASWNAGSEISFVQKINNSFKKFVGGSSQVFSSLFPKHFYAPELSVIPFGADVSLPLPQGAGTLTQDPSNTVSYTSGATVKNYYIKDFVGGISRGEFDARMVAMNLFVTNNIDSVLSTVRRSERRSGGSVTTITGSGTNFFSNSGIYTYLSTGSNLGIGTNVPAEALDVQGNAIVSGTATIGSLNGPLQANNGLVSATSSIGVFYGGTGITTAPTYGQILTGDGIGGYTLIATSSLGLAGSNFFSNSGIYTYLSTGSNLGIGTSTPGQRLSVAGDALISGNLTVQGNTLLNSLTATLATITDAIITNLTGTNFAFTNGTTTNATSTSLFATNAVLTNATSTNLRTTDLTSTNAVLTNATTTTLFTPTLVATNATTTTLYSTIVSALSGSFDSLFSINALFTNATTTNATSTNFFATLARITDGFFTNLTATLATITDAVITTLTGTNLAFTNATTTNATSTNFFATSATITNATSTNLSTTNLTSTNALLTGATTTTLYTSNLGLNSSYFTSLLGNGLTNSGGLLSVATSSLASGFFQQGGNSYGAPAVLGTLDNNPLTIITNNSTAATFLGNGNLGIGTTSPSERLSIAGNGLFSGNISAANITGTGTATIGALSIGSLSGFLKATAGAVTTSLIDLSTDVTSTLATGNGGTGITSYNVGDLLYVNNSGILATLPVGSAGQVLKVTGGVAAWGVDQTTGGSGGSSAWATTTDSLAVYPADTSDVVIIGNSATSTLSSIFEVHGLSYFSNNVGIGSTSPFYKLSVEGISSLGNRAIAGFFTATSTTASIFPYASTTALTVSGTNGLGLGNLNGPLQANNGAVSATSSIGVLYGGTGLTSAPTYGQILVGNSSGGYALTATSSLGLSSNFFQQNGNSYGALATLGTTDNNALSFITNNIERARFDTSGNLGIGSSTPFAQLSINPSAGAPTNIFNIGSSTGQLFNIANTGATTITSASVNALNVGPAGATNPVLNVSGATASQISGISLVGNATGVAPTITATDSGANVGLTIATKGTGVLTLTGGTAATGVGTTLIKSNASTVAGFGPSQINFLPTTSLATASTVRFNFTGAADTNLTASTEAVSVQFDIGQIRSHASGAITTQRDMRIIPSTHTFTAGTSAANATITNASSLEIRGVPIAGALGNITNAYALTINNLSSLNSSTTNAYGLNVLAPTGATNNYAAQFLNGNVGIGTSTPASLLSVQGNGLFSGNISAANLTATGTATIGSLTGLIMGTSGVLSVATAGTDYENPLTFNAPLSRSVNAISITQATTGANGYLSSTDFQTFNNKISSSSLSALYPLAYNSSTGVFTTAFGTTTANTYSGLNTFNGGLTISTLNGPLQANNGVVSATTSIGVLYGGTGLTVAPSLNQVLLGNGSGGYTLVATSSLGGGTVTSVNASGGTTGFSFAGGPITSSGTLTLSGTLAIANGGTNAISQTTNGVAYFDGTSLTTGTALTFDGSDLALSAGSFTTGAQIFGKNVDGPTTPTYSWTGDTSTGIYHPANNNIGFNTGGIERLRIDGNGYLGIGTTSATEALSVEGNGLFNGNLSATNITATGVGKIGTLTGLIKGTSGTLSVATAGTDYQAPLSFTYPLQNSSNIISLAFGTTTANSWSALQQFTAGASTTQLTATGNTYLATLGGSVGIATTSPWGLLSINPNGISGPAFVIGSTTSTELIVTNGGLIGIGTASPTETLTVVGTGSFTGNVTGNVFMGGLQSSTLFSSSNFATANSSGGTGATNTTNSNVLLPGASDIMYRMLTRGSTATTITAGGNYATFLMGRTTITEAASGNHPLLTGIAVSPLTITSGSATVATTSSLYIEDAATATVTGGNFALYVANGATWLNGATTVNGNLGVGTSTPGAKFGVQGDALISGTLSLDGLNGPLQANNGLISATTSIGVLYGGTGLTTAPTYGQMLIGNGSGGYTFTSTSTLGIVAGISSIGPAGQTQSGATITFATTTSTTNGVTSAITITGSGNVLTFTPSRSGTLAIAGGGTNSISQTTNGVTYFDGTSIVSGTALTFDGSDLALSAGSFTTGAQIFGKNVDGPTTPTYSWTGDTSTGIYHPANNNIGFNTGGIERLRIDGNGYLGIGTTSATEALSVEGNALINNIIPNGPYTNNLSAYTLGSTGSRWNALWAGTVNIGTSTWSLITGTNNRFSLFDAASGGGTERLSILTNGNVGIGTSTPASTFSVQGSALFSGNLSLANITATGTLSLGSLNGPLQANAGVVSATSSIGVLYGGTGLTSAPTYGQMLVGNSSGGYTLTATSSLGITGGGTNYFTNSGASTYLSTGTNLGIGTTTPTSQLSINPTAGGPVNIFTIGSSTGQLFNIANDGATTITSPSASALSVGLAGATNPALLVDASTASSATGLKIKSAAGSGGVALSAISSASSENISIDAKGTGSILLGNVSTGGVGIGTSTPTSLFSINPIAGNPTNIFSIGSTSAQIFNIANTGATAITSASANAFAVGPAGATNPVLNVSGATASQASGINIVGNATGVAPTITATDSGADAPLTIRTKGGGQLILGGNVGNSVSTAGVTIQSGGSTRFQVGTYATAISSAANANASTARFSYQGASDVTLTAATESPSATFNFATRSHASGAITTQRDFRITGATHTYSAGTSAANATIASSTVFAIDNPSTAGALGNITNAYALFINNLTTLNSSTTNAYGMTVMAPNGATNNFAATFLNGNVGIGTSSPNAGQLSIGMASSSNGLWVGVAGSTTPSLMVGSANSNGYVGIGVTAPAAQLHTSGTVRLANYASAGANVTTDASGNLSVASDERLKNISGGFARGLSDLVKLSPILYHWNAISGLEQNSEYAGFSAQNVQSAIPEAVTTGPNGYLTLADRPIIATAVNSIRELAGITNSLGTTTSSLAARLTGIETVVATQQQYILPQTLTVSSVTTGNISASNGITSASYTAPLTGTSYTFGSSTIAVSLPPEVLSTDGTNVDLYKLATYSLASVENLRNRTDLLAMKVDTIDARVTALELGLTASTTSGTGFSISSLTGALDSLGILVQSGIAQFNTLVFRQIIVSKDADGTSSASSVVVGHGMTSITVQNSLVHPSSKIFITFTSSVSGSWHIAEKLEGSFRVEFAQAQPEDVTFDYFIVQTEGQLATPSIAFTPNPPTTPTTPVVPPTPPTTPSTPGAPPIVTLLGEAAVQIAQGGAYIDPGATATDVTDGDISSGIVVSGSVDAGTPGIYTLTYTATNSGGANGEVSRIVTVLAPTTVPSTPPDVIDLPPPAPVDTPPDTVALL